MQFLQVIVDAARRGARIVTNDPSSPHQTRRRQLALMAASVAVFRVVAVILIHHHAPANAVAADDGYLKPALALLTDHAYLTEPGSKEAEFLRTPGYPAFLALALWIGRQRLGFVLVAQAIVSSCTVVVTYLLARRLRLPHRASLIAGALVTLDAYQIAIASTIQTETLATLTTTLIAWCGVAVYERPARAARWALLGTAIALSTFVRPSTVYLPIVVLAVGAGLTRKAHVPWARASRLALCFLLPLASLVAYSARNKSEFGSWSIASAEAITNYWYRAAWNVAQEKGIPWDPDARTEMTRRLVPALSTEEASRYRYGSVVPPQWRGGVGDYYKTAQSRAISIFLDDPILTARQFGRGVYSQLVQTGWVSAASIADLDPLPRALDYFSRAFVLLLNALAIVGLGVTLLLDRFRTPRFMPAILAAYLLAVSAGAQAAAGARMRAPFTPILAIFAVVAVVAIGSTRTRLGAAERLTSGAASFDDRD